MDPKLAQKLLESGAWSQDTYNGYMKQSAPPPNASAPNNLPAGVDASWLTPKASAPVEKGTHAAPAPAPTSGPQPGNLFAYSNSLKPMPEPGAAPVAAPKVAPPTAAASSELPTSAPKAAPKASGSSTVDSKKYDTKLTPDEEADFQLWKKAYAPNDSGADYDLRGAYKAGVTPDPNDGHFPDTWKKPNHPTFSNESQYAKGADAAKAGHWEGDTFVPPPKNSTEAKKQLLESQDRRNAGRIDQEKEIENQKFDAYQQGQADIIAATQTQLNDANELAKQRDARQLEAHQRVTEGLDQVRSQYKALGETKIDPDRKWKNTSDMGKFTHYVATALGGLSQGLLMIGGNKNAQNPAIEQWNREVDMDVKAQAADIQTKREALEGESNTLAKRYAMDNDMVGYMRAKEAEGWERLTHQVDVLDRQANTDIAKANLAKVKLGIEAKRDATVDALKIHEISVLERKEQLAAQAAAAQAAAVAKQRERVNKLTDEFVKGTDKDAPMSPDAARARAIATVLGEGTARATGFEGSLMPHERESGTKNKERDEAQLELDANVKTIRDGMANIKKLTDGTAIGSAYNSAAPKMLNSNDNINTHQEREAFNRNVMLSIGFLYKMRTGGVEPKNPKFIEEMAEPYELTASDNEETAMKKLKSLEQALIDAGAAKGAKDSGATSSAGPRVSDVKFK